MMIKQILEGARRFKPAPSSDPESRVEGQGQRGLWRWPDWSRWSAGPKDKYLIGIRRLRLPRA